VGFLLSDVADVSNSHRPLEERFLKHMAALTLTLRNCFGIEALGWISFLGVCGKSNSLDWHLIWIGFGFKWVPFKLQAAKKSPEEGGEALQ